MQAHTIQHWNVKSGSCIRYAPDQRQAIADSWPASIDDSAARRDWHWHPRYDLHRMTRDMLAHLKEPVAV